MKSTAAILAASLLLGCGVGHDDPEGEEAAFGSGHLAQSLGTDSQEAAAPPGGDGRDGSGNGSGTGSQSAAMTTSASTQSLSAGGGTVASPQDPIPAFDPLYVPPPESAPLPPNDPRGNGL